MFVLGIDPGLKGGWTILQEEGQIAIWGPTPVFQHARKGKTTQGKPDYDEAGMLALLRHYKAKFPTLVAVLEAVSTRPGQNAVSTLQTGAGHGLWRMALTATEIPRHILLPTVWKRHAGLLKQPKGAVRVVCQRRWPGVDWAKVSDGPMDAAVIADVWRTLTGRVAA